MSESISSPLSSLPNSQLPRDSTPQTSKAYRPVRSLPFELNSQITNYFEETLYTQAFALLESLVSSSAHADINVPTFVPWPTQLALASTLSVHPALTTRTTSKEKRSQADCALRLLRIVSQVLGPGNADFKNALKFLRFKFGTTRNSNGNILRNRNRRQTPESGRHLDDTKIDSKYAQGESLYSRAEDFWHVVGWAFNCSKLHLKRWERWVLWLEWMMDVLQEDWRNREQEGDVRASLIWSYISQSSGGGGRNRRILRSIFANGTTKSVNEFREVFKNELTEPKKEEERIKKREVDVDVEAEVYGDYMARDEDEASEDEVNAAGYAKRTRHPSLRRVTPKASTSGLNSAFDEGDQIDEDGPAVLGGNDGLRLRMRLLQLLSDVSIRLPDDFVTGDELYTMFVEFIRPLPLATFQAIISPSAVPDILSTDAQTTLCEFLLTRSLLEAAAPGTEEPYLRQSKMEECYLPFAATSSSMVDNAKVSLCLETLLRHLLIAKKLTARPALEFAIQDGIQNRCEKASDGGKKSASAQRREEIAWAWLFESGERLSDFLKYVGLQERR